LAYSRESEILRHNSAPYLHAAGRITKKPDSAKPAPTQKPFSITEGDAGGGNRDTTDDAVRIIETENGGSLNYVTWAQSIEAMKFFIEELKDNIEEELQLPNLSAKRMANLGNVGYDARKTILTDAHLKVGDEAGELVMFLEREWKVICAFLAFMAPSWKSELPKISCEHVITPFIQDDKKTNIETWRLASGNEPLISRQTALRNSGLVENVEAEMKLIAAEESEAREVERVKTVFEGATS
jgi:hypothetical protein